MKIGIFKDFDRLGRIVVPKELRERFALGEMPKMVAAENRVLILDPEYILTRAKKAEKA